MKDRMDICFGAQFADIICDSFFCPLPTAPSPSTSDSFCPPLHKGGL